MAQKFFVGGLSFSTSSERLRELFELARLSDRSRGPRGGGGFSRDRGAGGAGGGGRW